jgi:hypothetical protein
MDVSASTGYVSGWSNVAISNGGANVGRIILRLQERNLNAIGRTHKGGSERLKAARRDGTLQNMDCKYQQQAANQDSGTDGPQEVEGRIIGQEGHEEG